ncbi:PilT/PilU family type 4a pilus ATPase [Bengtsoniella intestinalis]|uniref:type IV pilus twitching motility protein PilT n=1 Tax=Bengtsoniella intestinalis TaxID=3073143 RepID=UPI00391F4B47
MEQLLTKAVELGGADIFLVPGAKAMCQVGGQLMPLGEQMLMPEDTQHLIAQLYDLAGRDMTHVKVAGDDDFSFAVKGLSRFRVNTYKQRSSLASVIRVIQFGIPDYQTLHIPETVMAVANYTKGLVLVTGPAGSGKSTTLACLIDQINTNRSGHIITLEDPIEYLHRNKKSIVSQREVGLDTANYVTALRACLRQAPDVILVGEMRDHETIQTALTAAETGHLVISTLHTVGAANTIDRIIDAFPSVQQKQIRIQLAMVLQGVISQQLVPTVDGGMTPAFEIMFLNNAIKNMVREAKVHQIDSAIGAASQAGMVRMDTSLERLVKEGRITLETAQRFTSNPDALRKLAK